MTLSNNRPNTAPIDGDEDAMLLVRGLSKTFRSRVKEPGLAGSFRALRRPTWKDVTAVDGIDLTVARGETLAFLGPNGAGKSTAIKMFTGILAPTAGSMRVAGLTPGRDQRALAYRIGSVFGQKSMLYWHLPATDSFRLLGAVYDVEPAELERRISALVALLEIGELLSTPVRRLSLGERMRCEVAASLLHKPEILFLDEPTIGLDVVVKAKIREMIRRINREEGVTVFLTSHDVGDVEQLCRRAVIINHGRVVLDGTVEGLKRGHLHRKIIRVQYVEPVSLETLDRTLSRPGNGLKVLKAERNAVEIEADSREGSMHDAMARVMACGEVADVTISEMPMEEIIASVFRQGTPDTAGADAASGADACPRRGGDDA